jgi:integrase
MPSALFHDGKLVRKALSTNFQVAKTMLADLRMKVYRESNGDVDNNRAIHELAKEWLRSMSQQLKPGTVTRYRQHMEQISHPRAVQALMGHKSLEMTMKIYAKVNDDQQRAAIGKLSYSIRDAIAEKSKTK